MEISTHTQLSDESAWSPLSHHAQVLRAPLFKSESTQGSHIFHVISIMDFPPAGYLPEPARTVSLPTGAERARQYTVKPYDVLITAVGTIGQITIVPEKCPDNWIPATNMFVVRFRENQKDKGRAYYGLMKSDFGARILQELSHGSSIKLISKKAFSRVPLPPCTDDLLAYFITLWEQQEDLYTRSQKLLQEALQVYQAVPELARKGA
ncbi:Type I restriction modification DNA specificity domain-containing protein [Alkalispirochaeta americana]|uniref:Type I restriction modification DNA specificity domain-containing protein n=1 Tax=Alkalispirochaeta americana TaxID=159291 RepID=A0A1N6UY64_9SPIO|nr:restriction endonuclease subunit S [Alkalispirochaeta americana]SIQ70517.1 Type I restriction modification DNA specificity domain-containing protein [Alkalispirochaeta americana]